MYLFGCVVIRDKQGRERFRMHVMTKINGWLQVYYFLIPKFLNTVMEHTILQTRINHCRVVNFIMINVVQYVLWFFFPESNKPEVWTLHITSNWQLKTKWCSWLLKEHLVSAERLQSLRTIMGCAHVWRYCK